MDTSREFLRAAAIAVVLPLLLVIVGIVLYAFCVTSPAVAEARIAGLLEELSNQPVRLSRRSPKDDGSGPVDMRMLRFNLHNQPAEVRLTVAKIDAAEASVRFYPASNALSLLAVVAGLAASVAGALGLTGIMQIGAKAKTSRDYMVSAFSRWRASLPLLLILQSSALVVALASICGFIAVWVYTSDESADAGKMVFASGVFSVILLIFGGVMVWRLAKSLRTVFDPSPDRVHGRALDKAEAPRLWEFVEDIARRVRSDIPDNVVVGLDRGFFVTARDLVPAGGGRLLSGRTLHLPLPLLAFLDREETAAIVGHELGHFTGEDLEYSQKFLPIYSGATQSMRAIDDASEDADRILNTFIIKPLLSVAEFFFFTFDNAVHHWSREREFEADKVGADAASARASAGALLRTSVSVSVIDEVLREAWDSPEKGRENLLAEMIERAREKGFEDPQSFLEDVQVHPTDTHPPTRLRVEAMGLSCDDPALLRNALRDPDFAQSAALQLLPGAEALCAGMVTDFQQAAAQHHEEMTAALEEAVADGEGAPFEIHEKTAGLVILESFVAALFIAAGLFGSDKIKGWGQVFVWAMAALMVWGVRHFYRRGREQPAIAFTATGFRSPGLAAEVPWEDVDGFEIRDSSGGKNISVELFLKDSARPPEKKKAAVRCKYAAKKNMISVYLFSLKKAEGKWITVATIEEELERRLRAVEARALLEKKKGGGAVEE